MSRRIAVSANVFAHGGGIESYTFDLVNRLSADGNTPTVYAARFDTALPEYGRIRPVAVNQKRVPKKLRPFFFARQLDRLRDPDELLIACNPSDHAAVFVCGGTHLGYLRGMGQRPNLIDRLVIRRNRTNYATARTIMAHSHLMRRNLTELYGVDEGKIRVVHPPVDTARFHNDLSRNSQVRRQYGFAEHETVFLFPSTGHRRKGLELLAGFFERTALPVKLAVAGSPLPRPMKNTVSLGFCRNMPELYRAADYTVMAPFYEPFGLVGVESVLSGTRVLLPESTGCTEVMNRNAGFFFDRSRPETLAAAVEEAVRLKGAGRHKIADPRGALTYDPSLSAHIARLYAMLDEAAEAA